MVVLTILLAHPVAGLFKMWATRKAADNDGALSTVAAGAVRIMA